MILLTNFKYHGMKIATAAVLLIKRDTNDTVIKNMDTVTLFYL